jgi:outer membrane protein
MKLIFFILLLLINSNVSFSANDLIIYLDSAYKNNPKLNAERKNLKATKENINISRSEFLPSISLSGSIDNNITSNTTSQKGTTLEGSKLETEKKTISIDQKIFQGFEGYNSLKKSELEVEQANFKIKKVEQEVLLDAAKAYFDLMYKSKKLKFNFANVSLFERQVESDSSRLQKGEITLTDLAQSESSLAGANAELISAETDLLTTKADFKRVTRVNAPKKVNENSKFNIDLPIDLNKALEISSKKNPKLLIAKLEYEISKKNLNIEKAKLSPKASINYSKSEVSELSSNVDNTDEQSVKATITWPLIKGGKNFSSIKKSRFKQQQNSLILEDVENEVKTLTTNAWSVYQSAESVLKATKAQVQAAEIANEGITSEYDSGNTRTTLEVIQSRSLLLNARIANAKAERDFVVSKLKLLSTIGSLSVGSIKKQ